MMCPTFAGFRCFGQPPAAVTRKWPSFPVCISIAWTQMLPSASMMNVTFTRGIPRGAGRIPARQIDPRRTFSDALQQMRRQKP